jgi:hypothetical protein
MSQLQSSRNVIPAKAGIQSFQDVLDPRFRGGDEGVFRGGDSFFESCSWLNVEKIPYPLCFLVVFAFFFLASCSGGGGKSDGSAGGESLHDANAPVSAESFQNSHLISLKVLDENGQYQTVSDGMTVSPGMKTMAVYVLGDPANIKKVLVGDGRMYQVEAAFDAGSYLCDFPVGSRLYSSVLVQVIHANDKASKEKFVFRTFDSIPDDQFIINGLGLFVSQDLLDSQLDDIAVLLDGMIGEVFDTIRGQDPGLITRLDYGDGEPGTVDLTVNIFEAVQSDTYPSAIIHTVFTIHGVNLQAVNLYGQDLMSTTGNDLTVELYVAVKDEYGDGRRGLVLDLLGVADVHFRDDFFLKPVLEQVLESELQVVGYAPLSLNLEKFFHTLGEAVPVSTDINNQNVNLETLFDKMNLDLNRRLFMDTYGLPGETDPGVLGLGMGLFLSGEEDIPDSGPQAVEATDVNEIFLKIFAPLVEESFQTIRDEYSAVTNISYGDGNPATYDFQIRSLTMEDGDDLNSKRVQAVITINQVDFSAFLLFEDFPFIHTEDNDLTIDADFLLTYQGNGADPVLVLDVEDGANAYFAEDFLGKRVVEEIVAWEVSNLSPMSIRLNDVFEELNFRVDLTDLGSGPSFPPVVPVFSSRNLDPLLPDNYSFGLTLSQDSLNEILSQLFHSGFEWDGYEIIHALLGTGFTGFSNTPGEETIVRLSVPPVFDFSSTRMRMMVDDVVLQNRKGGIPQWEISLDLDLFFDVRVEGGAICLYVSSVSENCHFHVMKDNTGKLGVLDHSNTVNSIVEALPEMLGRNPGDPVLSIDIEGLKPVLYFDDEAPLIISSGEGWLYLDAALRDIDLIWLFDKVLAMH